MPQTDVHSSSGGSNASVEKHFPRIAGHTTLERLYEGSICTIYRAKQDRLGRVVALKTLKEWPPPSDVALERFNRSTYVSGQVVHANLPVLYETGTADGYHYASMEFIQGQTLQEILVERGTVSERRAVWVALQVARALAALHERRIIHRNVKPKNILMEPDGKVRLVGLGLSRCDAACFSKNLDAQTIGTPHYMAPEIIRGCCTDARSDLYSLGVTMYVMVTGQPPFKKGIPAAVMAKHLYEKPRPVKDLRPDLSDAFVDLVEKLMAKCPHERLAGTGEAVERLEALARYHAKAKDHEKAWLHPETVRRVAKQAAVFSSAMAGVFVLGMAGFGMYSAWDHWAADGTRAASVASQEPAADDLQDMGLVEQGDVNADEQVPADEAAALPELVAAPGQPVPARREMENDYRRLIELDGVFRRDGWRGAREWQIFLRDFPAAPAAMRTEATARIERYKRTGRVQHLLEQPVDPQGEDLDF